MANKVSIATTTSRMTPRRFGWAAYRKRLKEDWVAAEPGEVRCGSCRVAWNPTGLGGVHIRYGRTALRYGTRWNEIRRHVRWLVHRRDCGRRGACRAHKRI